MSGSRLGGKRKAVNPVSPVSKLHVITIPTMAKALTMSRRSVWKCRSEKDNIKAANIGERPVIGEAARLKAAMLMSDKFVEDAVAYDSRLARKAQWRRSEEGEHVCAAALATGDDQPFYQRHRSVVNEATQAGEPMRIVISTDDNNVPANTAAAFIATSRLVQQFVPIAVWWQGAWLNEDRTKGFVFMVPLVQGDMDFSRLEFCIADPFRDSFSFQVMIGYAVIDLKETNSSCGHRATCAYHPTQRSYSGSAYPDYRDTTKFLSHHGIEPTPESIANTAAHWLGWQSASTEEWMQRRDAFSAGQSIPAERVDSGYKGPTDEDRARWKKQDEEAQAKAAREAAERMAQV